MNSIEWFKNIGIDDVGRVGGKNASLGEMYTELADQGISVPNGFATTADAYRNFVDRNGLAAEINSILAGRHSDDINDLEQRTRRIRSLILAGELTETFRREILAAYRVLSEEAGVDEVYCAVRSSATVEDLPEASFAGQQESYLMVHGGADVLDAVRRCFASLFTARAVSYREDMGIDETDIALSVCVQRMVRSDLASSGVMFTLDPDSGHRDVVYITAAWGLGENIVQGRVTPDAFFVHKSRLRDGYSPLVTKTIGPKELRLTYDGAANRLVNERTSPEDQERMCLSDDEVLQLARWAVLVEDHYSSAHNHSSPMDLEWAKDGLTGELFIVQARPETVYSQQSSDNVEVFRLTGAGRELVTGLAVGERIATGPVRHIAHPQQMYKLSEGDVLVTEITDPDWEPILKRAAALVTERGGRTSHAAIVARELAIPAVVGTGEIGDRLHDGQSVTVSCAEGEVGVIYDGAVPFEVDEYGFADLPKPTRTEVMLNVGDPSFAFKYANLPSDGVGLARMEFIFASHVKVHPLALTRPESLTASARRQVEELTAAYDDPTEFLVAKVAQGVGTLAAAFWPRPVILRFSDFKTNEYAHLLGGEAFEPVESNPMLGWRGASRYCHPNYRDGFELELAAVKRVREQFGLTNLAVMVPFCRTPDEGQAVIEVMEAHGLRRDHDNLEVYVMAEIPANVLLAHRFAEIFDGFSIGSNDLTQLTLGVDRDSESVAHLFNERDPAVKRACSMIIAAAKEADRKVGICGQAPADYPDFTAFLVAEGIDSISVTADALAQTLECVVGAEIESSPENKFGPT